MFHLLNLAIIIDKYAIDFNDSTHWVSNDNDHNSFIYINLPFSFLLEGYTIQTSKGDLHPKTWYISASNNGVDFIDEHKDEDEHEILKQGNGAVYYHSHAFYKPYKIFRIRYGSCYSDYCRFDINQIEFFGSIPHNTCNCKLIILGPFSNFLIQVFISKF